jgi:hypothetical protein
MNSTVKNVLRPVAQATRRFIRESVPKPQAIDIESHNQQVQRGIVNQYQLFRAQKITPYRRIMDAGFRVHSQFEEDGIILYVLSMIGLKTRRVVEMCCGPGSECMATNLILNHGFDGFLFDGSEAKIAEAASFFANKQDCLLYRPHLEAIWITAENVNDLLSDCMGEVDLLSLDLDGVDFWIWKANRGNITAAVGRRNPQHHPLQPEPYSPIQSGF